jgi:hypothetical protein
VVESVLNHPEALTNFAGQGFSPGFPNEWVVPEAEGGTRGGGGAGGETATRDQRHTISLRDAPHHSLYSE